MDAIEYNGHSYYVYSDVCQAWEEAKKYYENLERHLTVIDDEEENKQVYDIMHNLGYSDAYFGYTDAKPDVNWRWANEASSIYTNWSNGESNNERGKEHYAMFYYKSPAYEWNDGDFNNGTVNDEANYICEWDF